MTEFKDPRLPQPYYDARGELHGWLDDERIFYADKKYDTDKTRKLEMDLKTFGFTENGEWWVFVTNYLKRSSLLGLDTPQGRQAMGKTIVTMMKCLETAIVLYGAMPKAGVTSGVIE